MRKLFYLAFCLVLAMGVGCAVTDYETIVDNDQITPGSGGSGSGSGSGPSACNNCIVDTKGKAHIDESSQVAFSDGSGGFDETLWMVDQKANGNRKLQTFNNHSDASGPTFHDDLYCDTAFNGCAIWTANDPPGDVFAAAFDGSPNANCAGYSNLSFLTGTTRYYGECGRARMSPLERLTVLNQGTYGQAFGMPGLFYNLNHTNLTLVLDNNAGFQTTVPVTASIGAFAGMKGGRRSVLNMGNPLLGSMARAYADFLDQHGTAVTNLTLSFNGLSTTFKTAGPASNPVIQGQRVRNAANRLW